MNPSSSWVTPSADDGALEGAGDCAATPGVSSTMASAITARSRISDLHPCPTCLTRRWRSVAMPVPTASASPTRVQLVHGQGKASCRLTLPERRAASCSLRTGPRLGTLMPGTLASLLIRLSLDATGVEQGVARAEKSIGGLSTGAGAAMKVAGSLIGTAARSRTPRRPSQPWRPR